MIFNDQKTAEEFREKATDELVEFMTDLCIQIQDYKLTDKVSKKGIAEFVKMEMNSKFPKTAGLLLYRSGMIFPDDGHGCNPVILYYDDDNQNYYTIGQAMKNSSRISGGIVDGRIHT